MFMRFKHIKIRVLIVHLIITLAYPAAKAFISEYNRLMIFSDSLTIIGLLLIALGIGYTFVLHGDFDRTGFVFMRGQEQFCGTVDNYTPCNAWDAPCPPSEWLPCHPTGLYEAFFCLVAMGILLWMYYKRDLGTKQPGLMFGTFLVIIFGSRICIEFLKNVQVDFERNMVLDMGQWLSVPFVLIGIGMIVWSFVNRKKLG